MDDSMELIGGLAAGVLIGLTMGTLINIALDVDRRKVMSGKPFELKDKIYRCSEVSYE